MKMSVEEGFLGGWDLLLPRTIAGESCPILVAHVDDEEHDGTAREVALALARGDVESISRLLV
jgi:hypothetical protein